MTKDLYIMNIYSIRNPASNLNDYFKVLFLRTYDNAIVLFNTK